MLQYKGGFQLYNQSNSQLTYFIILYVKYKALIVYQVLLTFILGMHNDFDQGPSLSAPNSVNSSTNSRSLAIRGCCYRCTCSYIALLHCREKAAPPTQRDTYPTAAGQARRITAKTRIQQ